MRCRGRRWLSCCARRRRALVPWLAALSMLSTAAPARAQPSHDPARPAPEDDPRRGPRLVYEQGPPECLDEAQFHSEVAIAARDGVDHLHDSSPDVVRVRFEKIPGGFRGTVEHTDAAGATDAPDVMTANNCEVLARWVAGAVSDTIPRPPAPSCPAPPRCPASICPACPVCGTSREVSCPAPPKPPPWRMDLTVGLSAYVMMTAFLSADVGPAVGVAGSVGGDLFSLNAELRFVLPSRAYARDPVPGTKPNYPTELDVSQLTALLVPCLHYKYLVGCGVAQFGGIITKNLDVDTALTYSFGPRLGFEVPFAERFAVFGFGEVLFTPEPYGIDFTLPAYPGATPANTGWTQSVASAFFGAGVTVRFQ